MFQRNALLHNGANTAGAFRGLAPVAGRVTTGSRVQALVGVLARALVRVLVGTTAMMMLTAGRASAAESFRDGNGNADPPPAGVLARVGPAGLKTFWWDFGRLGDVDFDQWPDRWVRTSSLGYPDYVTIQIEPRDRQWQTQVQSLDTQFVTGWTFLRDSLPPSIQSMLPVLLPSLADGLVNRALVIRLDGGLARVQSPPLPTSPTFQYHFSVDVRTDGLRYDQAFAEVIFMDESGKTLQTRATEGVTTSRGWRRLEIHSLVPPQGARSMAVAMAVRGGSDGLEDIDGRIEFDNVLFRQFPQLVLSTDQRFGVYPVGTPVVVKTELLGLPADDARLRLRCVNQNGDRVDAILHDVSSAGVQPVELDGSPKLDWTIDNLIPGFYRVLAQMQSDRGASLANETTFVIIDPNLARRGGPASGENDPAMLSQPPAADEPKPLPFGWTLPRDFVRQHRVGSLREKDIANWMSSVGIGWAKIPVWFAPQDVESADAASQLAMRLRDSNIHVVGVLDRPPADRLDAYQLRDRQDSGIANLLRDVAVWRTELESLMNRLTLRIRAWQLGDDLDVSFTGQRRLAEMIQEIALGLQGFGQPIDITINWPWLDPPPVIAGENWKAIQRTTDIAMTTAELDAMLQLQSNPASAGGGNAGDKAGTSQSQTWLTIQPLAADRYDRDERIVDLVGRMAATRGHGVTAAFVPKPFDGPSDLLSPMGRPGEMLLPWRTTSMLLGPTRAVGSLRLQNGSQNVLYKSPDNAVLMIWSQKPTVERLFLGNDVDRVDVWGQREPLATELVDGRIVHRIDVSRVPVFLVGVDASLAQFRMSVDFDVQRIDSVLGIPQSIGVRFANPISQSLSGEVALEAPTSWQVSPDAENWELMPLKSTRAEFEVVLGNNATIGQYEIPIDFRFETIPPTQIRVYRTIDVGPEGFDLVVSSRMVAGDASSPGGGMLRVKIELTNRSDQLAHFDCLLFAAGNRQYERRTLVVAPGVSVVRTVDFPRGRELVGTRMLLRAIEQNGDRVINHTFEVQP